MPRLDSTKMVRFYSIDHKIICGKQSQAFNDLRRKLIDHLIFLAISVVRIWPKNGLRDDLVFENSRPNFLAFGVVRGSGKNKKGNKEATTRSGKERDRE